MKFRTKWGGAIYIVRPTTRGVNHLGVVTIAPGLRAVFDRDTHEFDSDLAQEKNNWSTEERQAVEKHLLTCKDYGNGLILMPGQEIPPELEVTPRVDRDAVATNCAFVNFVDGKVEQCTDEALPGSDKCELHSDRKGKVVRGMLTA